MMNKKIISGLGATILAVNAFTTAFAYSASNTPSISVKNSVIEGDLSIYLMMLNMYFNDSSYSFDMTMLESMNLEQAYKEMKKQIEAQQQFRQELDKYGLADMSADELRDKYITELFNAGRNILDFYSKKCGLKDFYIDVLSDTDCISLESNPNEYVFSGCTFREYIATLIKRAALFSYFEYKAERGDIDFKIFRIKNPNRIAKRLNISKSYYDGAYYFEVESSQLTKKGIEFTVCGNDDYTVLLHPEKISEKLKKHSYYISTSAYIIDNESDDIFLQISEITDELEDYGITKKYTDKILAYSNILENELWDIDDEDIAILQNLVISLMKDVKNFK